jgi:ribosomal protein S27AE
METYCQSNHCPKYFRCNHIGVLMNECPVIVKTCPKCGNERIIGEFDNDIHISYNCLNCGYSWYPKPFINKL